MKGGRIILLATLSIFMMLATPLGSARAIQFSDWEDTWHKMKLEIKAVCEENISLDMSNVSITDHSWVYIGTFNAVDGEFDAVLIIRKPNGDWQGTAFIFSVELGSAKDAILETKNAITIIDNDTGDEIVLYLIVRVKVNLKKGIVKSVEQKSVAGISALFVPGIAECIGSIKYTGKMKKINKVPQKVIDAKNAVP